MTKQSSENAAGDNMSTDAVVNQNSMDRSGLKAMPKNQHPEGDDNDDQRQNETNTVHQHEHEHEHHHHHHETRLYVPPHQRQRWGDVQIAPHTNWGDLFFDVFYVAAAYNLGNMLKDTPSPRGLLYTSGIFFPIMNLWSFKVYYDSRFYYLDDYYHRVYEILLLCALATAVLHIRPVSILSYPSKYPDMFIFCLSINIAYALAVGRLVEIVFCCKYMKRTATGLYPEASHSCRRDILGHIVAFGCLLSATIYSGISYFGTNSANATEKYNGTNYTSSTNDVYHRILAVSNTTSDYSTTAKPDAIPVWLLLGGTFSSCAWFFSLVTYFSLSKQNHKP
jgi:hypothetical protein